MLLSQVNMMHIMLLSQVNMMVTDTSGHHLVNRENVEQVGKFAFTTDKDDIFEICFISRVPSNMRGARQEVSIPANQRLVFRSRDPS